MTPLDAAILLGGGFIVVLLLMWLGDKIADYIIGKTNW